MAIQVRQKPPVTELPTLINLVNLPQIDSHYIATSKKDPLPTICELAENSHGIIPSNDSHQIRTPGWPALVELTTKA